MLRQDLFSVRERLFFLARDHEELAFDHPAYTSSRRVINGFLRFAHQSSILEIFIKVWSFGRLSSESKQLLIDLGKRRKRALEGLSPELRAEIQGVMDDANFAVLSYMLNTSILFAVVVQPLKVVALTIDGLRRANNATYRRIRKMRFFRRSLLRVDALAEVFGSNDRIDRGMRRSLAASQP
ncbi:MAG: hypothetical protein AAFN78_00950 [Pseudomonadota bacterium]